jgi:hypothetical protein
VGFEPTIPAFERAKTAHALDRAATVIISHLLGRKLLLLFPEQSTADNDTRHIKVNNLFLINARRDSQVEGEGGGIKEVRQHELQSNEETVRTETDSIRHRD